MLRPDRPRTPDRCSVHPDTPSLTSLACHGRCCHGISCRGCSCAVLRPDRPRMSYCGHFYRGHRIRARSAPATPAAVVLFAAVLLRPLLGLSLLVRPSRLRSSYCGHLYCDSPVRHCSAVAARAAVARAAAAPDLMRPSSPRPSCCGRSCRPWVSCCGSPVHRRDMEALVARTSTILIIQCLWL